MVSGKKAPPKKTPTKKAAASSKKKAATPRKWTPALRQFYRDTVFNVEWELGYALAYRMITLAEIAKEFSTLDKMTTRMWNIAETKKLDTVIYWNEYTVEDEENVLALFQAHPMNHIRNREKIFKHVGGFVYSTSLHLPVIRVDTIKRMRSLKHALDRLLLLARNRGWCAAMIDDDSFPSQSISPTAAMKRIGY